MSRRTAEEVLNEIDAVLDHDAYGYSWEASAGCNHQLRIEQDELRALQNARSCETPVIPGGVTWQRFNADREGLDGWAAEASVRPSTLFRDVIDSVGMVAVDPYDWRDTWDIDLEINRRISDAMSRREWATMLLGPSEADRLMQQFEAGELQLQPVPPTFLMDIRDWQAGLPDVEAAQQFIAETYAARHPVPIRSYFNDTGYSLTEPWQDLPMRQLPWTDHDRRFTPGRVLLHGRELPRRTAADWQAIIDRTSHTLAGEPRWATGGVIPQSMSADADHPALTRRCGHSLIGDDAPWRFRQLGEDWSDVHGVAVPPGSWLQFPVQSGDTIRAYPSGHIEIIPNDALIATARRDPIRFERITGDEDDRILTRVTRRIEMELTGLTPEGTRVLLGLPPETDWQTEVADARRTLSEVFGSEEALQAVLDRAILGTDDGENLTGILSGEDDEEDPSDAV